MPVNKLHIKRSTTKCGWCDTNGCEEHDPTSNPAFKQQIRDIYLPLLTSCINYPKDSIPLFTWELDFFSKEEIRHFSYQHRE